MAPQFLFSLFIMLLLPHLTKSDDGLPAFTFNLLDYKDEFRAGDTATIHVTILGNYIIGAYKHPFNPNISVNDKMGNTSYITAVSSIFNPDLNNWRILFMPIMVGLFNVLITDENFNVFDASMHYYVTPGPIYSPGGIVSWMGQLNNFVAGMKATLLILPKDAFGNNVTSLSEGRNIDGFEVYATYANGSNVILQDVSNQGWNGFGYLCIQFTLTTAGSFLAHVKQKNETLIGSPLPFTVDPDALDVGNCLPEWSTETESFQLFSTMETFINQRDKFGNLVPGLCAFDFDVMEKGTNLSLPIGDLQYDEVLPGIQSFSFKLVEPGDFILMISDKDKKNQILNMPYEFNVYIGYVDGLASIVNGSGLNNSVAGEVSKFSILLRDAYQYPSPLELQRLQVHITLPSLSLRLYPQISPMDSVDGTRPTGILDYGPFDPTGIASVPSVYPYNNSARNWKTMSSAFDVLYVPEKSGVYEIRVFCGNIPLNDGIPYIKAVSAGKVNSSISRIVNFAPKVSRLIVNDIVVQLMDSFSNPVLLQASNLFLQIASINRSSFTVFLFVDNKDGTYTGSYLLMEVGIYEMCVTFDVTHLLPCPFGVNAYIRDYFPIAYNDTVSVWEDESIAFNAVGNDFYAGGNATVIEYQKAGHGSVLQYGNLFRYTPYKGFYGNDSFLYTISDVNGNIASGFVNVYVLCIPPQFVSFPSELQANEDILGPKFGGFPGFEITYSATLENISVMLSAQHGTVFLSPLPMQLWDPMWSELSVSKMEGRAEDLHLVGRLEVINFALQSLQYIGRDENFSGTDSIRVSTINKNGRNNLDVPVSVKPINDPPFINVPEFIILKNETEDKGILIFDRQLDKFNFSIGDPDHLHFPAEVAGNESLFRVMFSLEVSSGFFSTKLPAELISTTELKLKNSKQWQPLQTFVEISGHFTVKAKGIRFRGTINDCNNVLQQLLYYGDEHGGVLRVNVNDMGWYGCYPDCAEMMSVPLISEATVNLITRMPVTPMVDHSVESVIVLELIVLSSLTMILLFFTCKCVIVLIHEKKKRQVQSHNIQLYKLQSSHEQTSSTDSSENVIPSPVKGSGEPSNLSNP
ncbi:Filamin/ABP280 repeat-like protein [Cynara cardunculus var. scolymus]|uniref:Filamin/ABP280 repeat-like protein n=1 Tax=Cynara cardunculus var. scolymus TaxID=59895 RepID=A0A118JS51_CYNCS|nr:Filamin/ABP280 repeat-like protein [Cynara cardunculus var. scolymus]